MSSDLFKIIRRDIKDLGYRNPQISSDNTFLAWYIKTFIGTTEDEAIRALKGKVGDKGIDAIYIDRKFKNVYVLQGKYHEKLNSVNEKKSDVIALASSGRILMLEEKVALDSLKQKAHLSVQKDLDNIYDLIHKENYKLNLLFITTGKVSEGNLNDAKAHLGYYKNASFETFSGNDLISHMQDYLSGLAPPIPEIMVEISNQYFTQLDKKTKINSYIFSLSGYELARHYLDKSIGDRLFARNIRGYLGDTNINKSMRKTAQKSSEYFWYLNNGITMICDDAELLTKRGKYYLKIKNIQIINGQQTTRVLSQLSDPESVSVIAKLFVLPRKSEIEMMEFENLINKIVAATNWQNKISQADLRSNDKIQVKLQRELRKCNYLYLRKEMTKHEAINIYGDKEIEIIKKVNLAQIIAACLFDPHILRQGKDNLFVEPIYSELYEDRSPFKLLTYYWLHRYAQYYSSKYTNSKGVRDDRRTYAKWLVLNQLNYLLKKELNHTEIRKKFIHVCEREFNYNDTYTKIAKNLDIATNQLYRSAISFYIKNRRKETGITEASNFFNHANRHIEFQKFYNSSKNSSRRQSINKRLKNFIEGLDSLEL